MRLLYSITKLLVHPELWILICLIGAWLLSGSTRRLSSARRLLSIGIFLFWGLGTRPISDALLHPLESRYSLASLGDITARDVLVVLASGSTKAPGSGSSTILGTSSLDHLICGVTMLRDGSARTLLFAGGSGDVYGHGPPEADVMRDLAIRLGASASAVLIENRSRTTAERAVQVRRMLPKTSRIALIDSALHLPRAAATFEKQGFIVVPVPCDYRTSDHPWDLTEFFPDAGSLVNSRDAIHEYIGLAVYWAMGRL